MDIKRISLYIAAAIVAIIIGLGVGYWTLGRPAAVPKTFALLLNPPKPLTAFNLEADDNAPFTKTDLEGRWSFLYFGYTHCPDLCPTTLTDLNKMMVQLEKLPSAEQPRVYFISVDPKRDTMALLKEYVHFFNPVFIGITGSVDQLHALADPLGVAFSYDPPDQSGNYSVDHSSVIFLINPKGKVAAIYTPVLIPERMTADYRAIVNYYGDR
ncbi:MAG: SCO family protein [Gammaproteobacteria bacterium]